MRSLLLIILMLFFANLFGQDSIIASKKILTTYAFDIENGKLIGDGATFLKKEMSNAQYTLLGEYHGSSRISEFTNAIIPVLDSLDYKTIVLEVGQHAGRVIDNIDGNPADKLESIYQKFKLIDEDGEVYLPLPFFEHQEDIEFLKSYKSHNWKTIGIDQEYYDGLLMIFDMLYNNLSSVDQTKYHILHNEVIDSLKHYYAEDFKSGKSIMTQIIKSPLISNYFTSVGHANKNSIIINSIKKSAEIYRSDWYSNYQLRVQHMKDNVRAQFIESDFDLKNHKLLAKLGAYHLSKGFSLWGAYEIGNTFNELATYHGNSALNITFLARYTEDDGTVIDLMDSDKLRDKRLNELRKYGKKNEWVIIDLRPQIKKYVAQSSDYTFNKYVEDYMKTYDLVIIPRTELKPKPFIE